VPHAKVTEGQRNRAKQLRQTMTRAERIEAVSGSANNNSPPPTRAALARARVQALRGRSDREAVREGGARAANHRPVPAIRRARARSLRSEMTEAEKRLWYWLRAHRFRGVAFRRQTPIGQYIVDFVSHERRLIIEIDGGQHNENKADALRDQWLRSKGYRVLRFWNSEILKNRDGVLERISDAICRARPPSRRSRTLSAIGDLPLKGGGQNSFSQRREQQGKIP
jgi:very-short-patch-repair endonuclease